VRWPPGHRAGGMLAFYGDEETETEAEALFSREDAEDALRTARPVVELCTTGRRSVKRPS